MQLVDIDGDGFVRNWCNVDQLFGPMVPHWWTIEVPPSTERFQRSFPLATAGKRPWESRNVLVWECIVARRSKANLSVAPMWCFFSDCSNRLHPKNLKTCSFGPADHWGNLLGFDGAVALSRGLRGWPAPGCRLQVLTLRENRLGDGGVGAIAEASGGLWSFLMDHQWINGKSPIKVQVLMGKEIQDFWSQCNRSCSGIDRGLGRQCGPQRIRSFQQRGSCHGLGLGGVGRASWGSLSLIGAVIMMIMTVTTSIAGFNAGAQACSQKISWISESCLDLTPT